MSLRVVEPGLCSLIVDGGRPRTRSLGVPCGGPADRAAFVLGNAMLGNQDEAAALEISLAGPVLQALDPTGMVVIGSPLMLGSNRQRMIANQSFTLEPGEELHIGGMREGARAYLCVAGGFLTPEILGSRSALTPIRRGDELPCRPSSAHRRVIGDFESLYSRCLSPLLDLVAVDAGEPRMRGAALQSRRGDMDGSGEPSYRSDVLRVLPGPEADWFPSGGRELFQGSPLPTFTVSPESNRMGLRLAGIGLPVPPREMVSQPVCPGTIQVTRAGQLILLGVDGQTIGGYPRIAHVISADLDRVGQLRPGERVTFSPVTLEQAEQIGRHKRAMLELWCLRLRTAAGSF